MDAAITSRDDVRRVLVAGDTQGNTAWVDGLVGAAAEQGCPIVIQIGDVGYFPDHPDGPRFLTAVDTACSWPAIELDSLDICWPTIPSPGPTSQGATHREGIET